jgi:hypothetical protein
MLTIENGNILLQGSNCRAHFLEISNGRKITNPSKRRTIFRSSTHSYKNSSIRSKDFLRKVGKTEVHSSIQLFHLNYGLP